jgi:hypothetical protein
LLHGDIVKKNQMLSNKPDVMPPHYMKGEEVTAPEAWSGDEEFMLSPQTERS